MARCLAGRVGRGLAAALLVAAACSNGGDGDEPRAGESTENGGVPGDEDDDGPAGPVATDSTTDGSGPAPDGSAPSGDDPAAPPAAPPSAGPAPAPADQPVAAPTGVGAYAAFYLRAYESARVLVDIRSQAGAAPSAATVDHLRQVLAEVTGKQVDVGGGELGGGARQWTPDELRATADSSGVPQSRDRAVLRLLFVRGGLAGEDTVLGVAVRADVAAVFADRIDDAAGPLGNRGRIEDAITVHEVGHLIGLVDLFLDRGRSDPDHPGHSPNRGSVMYHAVESTLVGSILTGGPPTDFDADDRAELAAIRDG